MLLASWLIWFQNGTMTITLKDLPDEVHQSLRLRAKNHGRSLNKEMIEILSQAVTPQRRDPVDFLRRVEARRDRLPVVVQQENLETIIGEGRS